MSRDVATPNLIGARITRREDPRFLTGTGRFVDDVPLTEPLHIAFRRAEVPHAHIRSVDVASARAHKGVVAVITGETLAEGTKTLRATSRMSDYHATDFVPLAHRTVRFVGEPVAAVIASDRYVAEDAAAEIDVHWERIESVVDWETALADETLLHEEAGTNVLVARTFARGDADRALAQAAIRVRRQFRFHRKCAAALENRCVAADFDPGRRALTVYSATQVPGLIRDALCEILGLPGNRVRVVAPDVGGGFGAKASVYPEEVVVAFAAMRLGRAVKWTGDRIEDLTATSQAFDEVIEAELGVSAEGTLLGLVADVVGDVGAYSIYPWTAALEPVQVVSFMPGPYRLADYRARVRGVATNKAPAGPYRGVGRPISTFVMERLIDLAANELGIEPHVLRARNLVAAEDFPYRVASGLVWDGAGFGECLRLAGERIDSVRFRERQHAARGEGRLIGLGFASYAELTGIGSRISAAPGMPINTGTEIGTVTMDATGAITASFGIASHGQGLETSLSQVLGEELGASLDDIEIIHGDSAAVPHSTGTYASRSAVLAGGAATLAARDLRAKIVRVAALLLEASQADIEVRNSTVSVMGTDRRLSFSALARAFYSEMGRIPKEERAETELSSTKLYDPFFGTTSAATHAAVVEVDPETFQVRILDYVVAEDCGRVINPLIVDGQVRGGVAQGIGAALLEETVYAADGQHLSATFVDYLVPGACEVPSVDVLHVESPSPSTLGGFRGMGEGGTIGAPAAIANAISDALAPLGVEVNELPATPERLFRRARTVEFE